LLSVGAVIGLTRHYFSLKERELREKINAEAKMTPVVVARSNLPVGARLTSDTVAVREIPADYIPSGAITPEKFSGVEGKILSEPLASGKPLLKHYIKGIIRVDKFSDLLQPGQRALTLQVDGVNSVEHMIESGDYIDLAVRYKKGSGFELLLERVMVLSTGNITTADPKAPGMYKNADYSTITLGVDDNYVQKVFEAHAKGDLAFLLRNEKDDLAARYSSMKGGAGVVVFAGKKAEAGLLNEVQDGGLVQSAFTDEMPIRNDNGRLVKRSSIDVVKPPVSESAVNEGVAINHEQK